MNARTKPETRFAATLIAALLFALGAGLHRTAADPAHAASAGTKSVQAPHAIAATSSPALAPVLLPQIVVRPTASERAAAATDPLLADNHSPFLRAGDEAASSSAGGGYASSPRMNFDMPYYAFGKTLPRSASRE